MSVLDWVLALAFSVILGGAVGGYLGYQLGYQSAPKTLYHYNVTMTKTDLVTHNEQVTWVSDGKIKKGFSFVSTNVSFSAFPSLVDSLSDWERGNLVFSVYNTKFGYRVLAQYPASVVSSNLVSTNLIFTNFLSTNTIKALPAKFFSY